MNQPSHLPLKPLFTAITVLALSLPAAAADVRLSATAYGFLNGELESVSATGGATPYAARGRVSDGNSRLGFRGVIGVDDDLSGVWQIEGAMNSFEQGGLNGQGRSATLSSRNTFVGIQSQRFGTVIVGNNDSVYRSLVGSGGELGGNVGLTVHGLDVLNNTSAQMSGNSDSVFGRGEARYKNSVHYLSPQWNGLQAGGSYGFDEAQSGNANHSRYSVAVKYSAGALSIGAGAEHQGNTGVDTDALVQGYGFHTADVNRVNTTFYKLLAVYRLPTRTTVGAGFEQARYGFEDVAVPTAGNFYTGSRLGHMKQNALMVSLTQEFGAASVMLAYGKLGKLDNTSFASAGDFEASQVTLGATYKLNEFFTPYVYFTKIRNHAQQSVNLGQAPLYSNHLNQSDAFLAPGDSPRAFGIGLIARF
ncbi:porin [Massilia sp. PWRC2]|uniref:porin n=1 Tax=Massilia sp. PWRC2 TaxID=2804626 RepID=UPI003CEB9AD5